MGGGQTGFDVKVLAWRGEVDAVVAAIQSVLPVDNSTARQLFDRAPLVVKRAISRDAASAYVDLLEGIGAQVEVVRSGAHDGAQDRGATLLMAVDVREFVGEAPVAPGGEPSDNLRIEPFWDPSDRAAIERARAAADTHPMHDRGLCAASLPAVSVAMSPAGSRASTGLPVLPEPDGGSIPPALLGDEEEDDDDGSIPPALLGDDEEDELATGYGLLSSDPPRAIGSAAAPGLELGVDLSSIRPQRHADVGLVATPSTPLARAFDSGAAAASRLGSAALDRVYVWADDNSDEPSLPDEAPAAQRVVARVRREFAVFLVWALDFGERLWSKGAASRERARAAPPSGDFGDGFASDRAPSARSLRDTASRSAEPARRRLDLPPVPLLALGLCVFVGGVRFDSSIFLGTAGVLSVALHGLAIFVLGLALAALVPRRLD